MMGVEIHANTVRTLLDGTPIVPVRKGWMAAALVICLAVVCVATLSRGPLTGALVAILVLGMHLIAGMLLMHRFLFLSPSTVIVGLPLVLAGTSSYRAIARWRSWRW